MLHEDSSNPYIIGPDVQGDNLFGRQEVLDFVRDALLAQHQSAVVLYGQRRVGKTSILKEIPYRLPVELFHFVYFDLSGQAALPLSKVIYNLADEIAISLSIDSPSEAQFERNGKFFQSAFLSQVYGKLGNKRLLLLMDEFDVLSDFPHQPQEDLAINALFPYLGRLLDEEDRLAFVFVIGRRLEELRSSQLRVFRGAPSERIWLLRREDAVRLIREPAQGRLEYRSDAIEAILALTNGHPYFTQLVCYELYNHLKRRRRKWVSARDVTEVIEHALSTGEPAFVWLWDGFDPSTQLLISAVAQLNKKGNNANHDTIRRILKAERLKLPRDKFRNWMQYLVDWGLLKRDTDDGLRFEIELVYLWVAAKRPLSRMKTESNEVLDRLFSTAQQAQNTGKLAEAIECYRKVLDAHPNYIRAQLGLGAALLSKGEKLEAIKAYEEAYWLDAFSSKEGLITARLAYAEGLEKERQYNTAAIQYQKILEVDPANRNVQTRLDLLYRRGQAAVQTQAWREAARYLGQICKIQPDYKDAPNLLGHAQSALKEEQQEAKGGRAWHVGLFAGGAAAALILVMALWVPAQRGNSLAMMLGWITPSPTPTTTITPGPPPTQTLRIIVVTATPETITPTKTSTLTKSAIPTDQSEQENTATRPPKATPPEEPTLTLIPSLEPTPAPPPTEVTPSSIYDAPQLIAPDNEARFAGEHAFVTLQWEPIPNLRENEFYSISLRFFREGKLKWDGDEITDTSWLVPWQAYYLQADGPERRYEWDITVYRRLADGSTHPVSPTSETRVFFWIE